MKIVFVFLIILYFTPSADLQAQTSSGELTKNRWVLATDSAPWKGRTHHIAGVFDNKMWVIGGWTIDKNGKEKNLRDVWYSTDGVNWTQATDSTPWRDRHNQTFLDYKDKMWLFGGYRRTGFFEDVWNSSDGVTWTQIAEFSPWGPRDAHTSVVFDNKMWVIGGDAIGIEEHDVWNSSDGILGP